MVVIHYRPSFQHRWVPAFWRLCRSYLTCYISRSQSVNQCNCLKRCWAMLWGSCFRLHLFLINNVLYNFIRAPSLGVLHYFSTILRERAFQPIYQTLRICAHFSTCSKLLTSLLLLCQPSRLLHTSGLSFGTLTLLFSTVNAEQFRKGWVRN